MNLLFLSKNKKTLQIIAAVGILVILLVIVWLRSGFDTILLDTDFGRDLSEMSNIRMHRVVWLGPQLSAGFPTSPIYYYLFFPALALAHWNPQSLIVANIILGSAALIFFGICGIKKWGRFSLVVIALIGLTPLWQSTVIHPGNGYTYILWLFFSLAGLWFEIPLFVSSLFLGIAIAHHPAAIFGLFILAYEWWRRNHSIKQLVLVVIGLTIPWAPIIAFEIITKGFLIRSWIASRSHDLKLVFQFSIANWNQIGLFLGLNAIVSMILLLVIGHVSQKRTRIWFYCLITSLLFFIVIGPVFPHYLLGVSIIFLFVATIVLSERTWGRLLIILLCSYLFFQTVVFAKPHPPMRSISKINTIVEKYIESAKLNKQKRIAVVAVLSQDTSVPQADDYRYFLRVKGYTVLDVQEYSQADTLLMFVEVPTFNWQKWSSWETDQFGSRKIRYKTVINGITIIQFDK